MYPDDKLPNGMTFDLPNQLPIQHYTILGQV